MTNTKKMTKRDYFNILRSTYPVDAENYAEVIAFIDKELGLLERKNSAPKKPTATQIGNEALKDALLESMVENTYYTVADLIKNIPCCEGLSTSKVSSLVNAMVKKELLTKTTDKRRSYFSIKVAD